MMMTPAQLIDELQRRGHTVTRRKLTDRLAKDLLPPLVRLRRERGRGAKYGWEELDIVDHAATVEELLDEHYRVKTALLGTWFLGYRVVDINKVRQAWLARVTHVEKYIKKQAGKLAELDDLLGPWASGAAKKLAKMKSCNLSSQDLDALLLLVLNTVFDQNYCFDEDDSAYLDSVNRWRSSKVSEPDEFRPFDSAALQGAFIFIQKHVSLASIRKTVSEATDEALGAAHRSWVATMRMVAWLARASAVIAVTMQIQNVVVDRREALEVIQLLGIDFSAIASAELPDNISDIGKRFAIVFGAPGVLALLYLGNYGAGPLLDDTIHVLDEFIERGFSGPTRSADPWSGFPQDRLAEIWHGFDKTLENAVKNTNKSVSM
jgi:hypothetical protein